MHSRKTRNLVSFVVSTLVFAASVLYLVGRFQWRAAFTSLLAADFVKLVILLSISHFAYIIVRAWRWRSAVCNSIPHVAFSDYYWITAIVVSLAILTPGQLGETLKVEVMRRRGLLGRLPGIGAFALERILDLVIISSMGAIGVLFGSFAGRYPGLKAGAAILIVIGLI